MHKLTYTTPFCGNWNRAFRFYKNKKPKKEVKLIVKSSLPSG